MLVEPKRLTDEELDAITSELPTSQYDLYDDDGGLIDSDWVQGAPETIARLLGHIAWMRRHARVMAAVSPFRAERS